MLVIIGLITGLFLSILGPAGGVVATPLLYYLLNINFLEANFITCLLVLLICIFYSIKNIEDMSWLNSVIIGISGAIFTSMGVAISHFFSTIHIKLLFSIVTCLIAIMTISSTVIKEHQADNFKQTNTPNNKPIFYCYLLLLGILSGLLSGLLGIGGGFFIIPILTMLAIPKTIAQHISFTSVGIILASSLSYKFFYHALHDKLEILKILYFILSGSISFMCIQLLKTKIRTSELTYIFCFILILMSYFEFIQYITN
jgi:uncharacterized membrane protein YfcA